MKYSIVLAATAVSFSTIAIAQTEREHDSHEHGSASLNVVIDKDEVFVELNTPWNNLVGFEHQPGTDEQKALVEDATAALIDPEQLFSFDGGNCTVTNSRLESTMQLDEEHHDDAHKDDDHHDGDGHKDEDHHDGDEHKDEDHHDADEHKDEDHHDADGHKDEDHHDADGHKDEDHHDGDGHKDEDHHDGDGHKDEDHHDGDGHKDEDHHDDDAHKDEDHHDGDAHKDDEHEHDHDSEPVHSAALVSYSYTCTEVADLTAIDIKLFALWSGFEDLDVQLAGPGGQSSAELNPDQTTLKLDSVQ